jgi:hypothetical protein
VNKASSPSDSALKFVAEPVPFVILSRPHLDIQKFICNPGHSCSTLEGLTLKSFGLFIQPFALFPYHQEIIFESKRIDVNLILEYYV